jgi:hypothetical protein
MANAHNTLTSTGGAVPHERFQAVREHGRTVPNGLNPPRYVGASSSRRVDSIQGKAGGLWEATPFQERRLETRGDPDAVNWWRCAAPLPWRERGDPELIQELFRRALLLPGSFFRGGQAQRNDSSSDEAYPNPPPRSKDRCRGAVSPYTCPGR